MDPVALALAGRVASQPAQFYPTSVNIALTGTPTVGGIGADGAGSLYIYTTAYNSTTGVYSNGWFRANLTTGAVTTLVGPPANIDQPSSTIVAVGGDGNVYLIPRNSSSGYCYLYKYTPGTNTWQSQYFNNPSGVPFIAYQPGAGTHPGYAWRSTRSGVYTSPNTYERVDLSTNVVTAFASGPTSTYPQSQGLYFWDAVNGALVFAHGNAFGGGTGTGATWSLIPGGAWTARATGAAGIWPVNGGSVGSGIGVVAGGTLGQNFFPWAQIYNNTTNVWTPGLPHLTALVHVGDATRGAWAIQSGVSSPALYTWGTPPPANLSTLKGYLSL